MDPEKTATGEDTPAKVDQPIEINQPPKEEEKKPDEVVVDHKAEADKLRDQLKKAEHTIVTLKKEKKPKADEGDDEEDKSEGVRPETVDQIVKSVTENILQKTAGDVLQEELVKLAADADERAHIKLIYDNKIVRSGFTREDIAKDLETARAIANAPRILKNVEEIQRAALAKTTTESNGSSSGASIPSDKPTETNFNAAEMALFQLVSNKTGIPMQQILKK